MTKKWKIKNSASLVLLLLLSSIAYTTLAPNAYATELTTHQKGLSIIGDVAGFDLSNYAVTSTVYPQNDSAKYLDVAPQENILYRLISKGTEQNTTTATSGNNTITKQVNMTSGSVVNVLCTFANGNLQMLHVLDGGEKSFITKTPATTNAAELAKSFLGKFQAHTQASLYGELLPTLDNIDVTKNFTKTSANTLLEATTNNGYTIFKWTYAANGAVAPSKFIAIGFNNGELTYFVDNWQFYQVANTNIAISEQTAKNIALEAAKTHPWSLKLNNNAFDETRFNQTNACWTALVFDGSLRADKIRSADPLALYPVWRVGVGLDKWYGSLYGITVDIWADTGEIRAAQEAWSTITPQEAKNTTASDQAPLSMESLNKQVTGAKANWNLPTLVMLATIFAAGISFICISKSKNIRAHNLLKPHFLKAFGMLSCALMISIIFLGAIETANATNGARVWGSESFMSNEIYGVPSSWRKHPGEVELQRTTSATIAGYFAQAGFTAPAPGINRQGWTSLNGNILSDLIYMRDNNAYAAVVDFDHGVGRTDAPGAPIGGNEFHYMMEDFYGTVWGNLTHPDYDHAVNAVYDMQIYDRTNPGEIAFAFINTCKSASITNNLYGYDTTQRLIDGTRACGMPFAWTHRTVQDRSAFPTFNIANHISDDGYSDPDAGSQCYIGFPEGSASLQQTIPANSSVQYQSWVVEFFRRALSYDISVNNALDQASIQSWGLPFGNSPLHTGFNAYWYNPNDPEGDGGWWETMDAKMVVYGNGYIHLRNYAYATGWADTFNDGTIDVSKWERLEASGGHVYERNNNLEVEIPSGSGWAQAGYVTTNAYNMQNGQVTVEVTQNSYLDQMMILIGNDKVASSDPYSTNNFFRVVKGHNCQGTNTFSVESRVNGNYRIDTSSSWLSPTGSLSIMTSNGMIYFYENGQLRYSRTFDLPSTNCYIYVMTSSAKERGGGLDKFDSFTMSSSNQPPDTPLPFNDDFNDLNYNGWTVYSGSWAVQDVQPGILPVDGEIKRLSGYQSLIRTNQQFAQNRYVSATVKTISAGYDSWDVPWVIAKHDGTWQNMVYGLIHTNGNVELAVFSNWNKHNWGIASSLNPFEAHTITISIIGTTAKLWVDGTLYLTQSDSYFDDFSGSVALYSHQYSTGQFDDVTVIPA